MSFASSTPASTNSLTAASSDFWIKFESGVSVCNKTEGIAQVKLKGKDKEGDLIYAVSVYGKNILHGVKFCNHKDDHELLFYNSKTVKLYLIIKEKILVIAENDGKLRTQTFIELTNVFRSTYRSFTYIPEFCTA